MKKIWKILLIAITIIAIGVFIKLVYPVMPVKHTIERYNLSFWCSNCYKLEKESDKLKVYSNDNNSISIEVYEFQNGFLNENSINEKIEDYKNLLSAVNYESVLQNDNIEVIRISDKECGKYETEIKSLKQIDREITLIIPYEEYDLIFSIHGTKEDMNTQNKSVERIIKSVKFK